MRARLADGIAVQRALGATDFPLADPYEIRLFEDVRHRSNSELMFELYAVQILSGGSLVFILCGLWAMVILWSITTRGDACRKRFSHSSWLALFMPSAETIQVVVIACFIQLVLCLGFHMFLETGTLSHVISYGIFAGSMGALSISVMNMWIRGESIDLANALSIDKIDKVALGWNEDVPLEDETDEEARAAAVQYCHVYDINPTGRRLGHLAAHDWEAFHKSLEERMGLGMFDLSEQVFDEAKPEKDPGMLAAFLNSKMMSLFGVNKDQAPADAQPKMAPEMHVCAVEVPIGLPRTTLRDALLQWRLRHTAHPVEAEAVDWALGQLEPSGFELTAVKVPENLRLVIVEALLAHSQKHAELQLDACHAARLRATLQQLSNRFCDVEVGLPDDCQGTEKVRSLLAEAIRARLTRPSKRDVSLEEGSMLQQVLGMLSEEHGLVALEAPTDLQHAADEERVDFVKAEIERRAEALRDALDLYDDEIYSPVPLLVRTKPVDGVEYSALASYFGSVPLSFLSHFGVRYIVRQLRKHAALWRGRFVEGQFRKTQSLAARKGDGFAQMDRSSETIDGRPRMTRVMSRANLMMGAQIRPFFSTFLEQKDKEEDVNPKPRSPIGPDFDFGPANRAPSKGTAGVRGRKLVAQKGHGGSQKLSEEALISGARPLRRRGSLGPASPPQVSSSVSSAAGTPTSPSQHL
ncbi:hypothetical protein Ctob_006539 [Chrysochromulina tobinii]|uniref:Uncharacterized protein n=1 Tax=Chrysochromulina tobinii TaxID=1460289 RepID=A0A0M0JHL0_9EUKA|nr:hypothetical protein Ctob_006539 [Chrysochromulina tobinii]|eukprot:KOO25733.1 hypothetical protein Ctob_006539 [Chrysochromulina sp. CCMP291]